MLEILAKDVGNDPKFEKIENSWESMSSRIRKNAYFGSVLFNDDIVMWIDDEGAINNSPLNLITSLDNKVVHEIYGNVFFTGLDSEGNTMSLNNRQSIALRNSFFILPTINKDEKIYSLKIDLLNHNLSLKSQ